MVEAEDTAAEALATAPLRVNWILSGLVWSESTVTVMVNVSTCPADLCPVDVVSPSAVLAAPLRLHTPAGRVAITVKVAVVPPFTSLGTTPEVAKTNVAKGAASPVKPGDANSGHRRSGRVRRQRRGGDNGGNGPRDAGHDPPTAHASTFFGLSRGCSQRSRAPCTTSILLDFLNYEATRSGLTCWFGFCSGVA